MTDSAIIASLQAEIAQLKGELEKSKTKGDPPEEHPK